MIKNFKFAFFVVIIAAFSFLGSCMSEEKSPTSNIVGTWSFDSYSLLEASINGQPALTYLSSVMGLSPQVAQTVQALFLSGIIEEAELETTTFTFNADGTYVVRIDGVEEDSGTYSLQNNNTKLALTSVNGNQDYDVTSLTNNRLVLVLDESESYDVNTDGKNEEVEFAIQVTLVK
ncbi:DUF4923 family protein [Aquiflexum sp. TKW24L]|uniref:lipocalin-like domain-containing protein n=1 Tax=Aquiflexum sp. TKW24L TaxID=2942212 RepID=UPI0020BFBB27|nr:DUF4923 family protein [Aquiflexum sp. TKW24L]MCL6260166.1 DUF4923 family protein [Aquiflexum sp. TKW24L]